MINLLQYYSKTEDNFLSRQTFHDVITNNASSGLREMLYL